MVEITNLKPIEFYEVGKVYNIACNIAGYPLPEIEWSFMKCPYYPKCEESYTKIPVNF